MPRSQCEKVAELYFDWLRQHTYAEAVGEVCEITTPFLDRHNDHIQIYASEQDDAVTFSDDGETLSELASSLFVSDSIIEETVRGLGVERRGTQLQVISTKANTGRSIHALIQAIVAVNYALIAPGARKLPVPGPQVEKVPRFREAVRIYLDIHSLDYRQSKNLLGKSGLNHKIHFLIRRPSNQPEGLLQILNRFDGDTIGKVIFALTDVREGRVPKSEAYAFLNDRDHKVSQKVSGALEDHDIKPIRWHEREEFAPMLVGSR